MSRYAMPYGEVSALARQRIRSTREAKRLTQRALAARLDDLNRHYHPTSLSWIESGKRRIDVDDLVVFALALRVSPLSLIVPENCGPADRMLISGKETVARDYCLWVRGDGPPPLPPIVDIWVG